MKKYLVYLKALTKSFVGNGCSHTGRLTCRVKLSNNFWRYRRVISYYFLPLDIPGAIISFGTLRPLKKGFCLILFQNGVLCYSPRTSGLGLGDFIDFSSHWGSRYGSGRPLHFCLLGSPVHHLCEGRSTASLSRSYGSCSKIMYHYSSERKTFLNGYSLVKLPSGEQKLVKSSSFALLGYNFGFLNRRPRYRKASDTLFIKKRRSIVRGVAKNPVDHPHGGGEGKTSGGRPSTSPWGWLTKGPRTRVAYAKKKHLVRRHLRLSRRKK